MFDAELALERFLVAKRAAGRAPRTVAWYADLVGDYLAYVAGAGGAAESVDSAEAFLAVKREQRPPLADETLDGYYRALRGWFNWCVRRQLIASNPMDLIERAKPRAKPVAYVEMHEFMTVHQAIDGNAWTDWRDRAILLLLYWSGLRVAELVGLRRADVDVARRIVTVHAGKGGESRHVPCAPELGQTLLAYLVALPPVADAPEGPPLLWSNDGNGGIRGPLSVEGVRQMLRRRCAAAGVRYMRPHLWRHGFAMLLLNNGMELSALSKAMGHASPETTRTIYAKWLTDGIQRQYEAAQRRAARLGGATTVNS